MTATNRVRLTSVKELTLGVTPGSPRMRARRYTADTLKAVPSYIDGDEIREDRMNSDPTPTIRNAGGGINGRLSYPVQDSPLSVDFESAFFNTWSNKPSRFNDGTADSVITNVDSGTSVVTVTTGDSFIVGHLVLFSGFTNAGNNAVRRCTTASATAPVFLTSGLVTETAPPAQARMKVVGFQGTSGDITATATGLASTAADFTTLGLSVGEWIKIGGSLVGQQFATAANNTFVRVTAIATNALTLDNLPAGWAVDAGSARTIRIWMGDFIKNGLTVIGQTIEKGYMAQGTPGYQVYRGMVVDTFKVSLTRNQEISVESSFKGMSSDQGTVSLDVTPDAQTTNRVMAAHAHVGRIGEAGATVTGPNWVGEVSFNINNNLRTIEDISNASPVDIQPGECEVTGTLNTYFGDLTIYSKFLNGTAASLNARAVRDSQAIIFSAPRITYRDGGDTPVTGKNADVMLNVGWKSSFDSLTGAHLTCTRMEYIES